MHASEADFPPSAVVQHSGGRPKLVFVTSRFPYPTVGGDRLRVFHLLRQLAVEFDVHLISLSDTPSPDTSSLIRASGISHVSVIFQSRATSGFGALRAWLSGLPLQVGFFASAGMQKVVDEALRNCDVAIFHLIRCASYWRRGLAVPAVLEMCDAISENLVQTAQRGPYLSPWRLVTSMEAPRVARFEREQIGNFDLVTLHARKDAQLLSVPPEKLLLSTQGTDLNALPWMDPARRRGRSIALIGKMDAFPNRTAAKWFANSVLPILPGDITLKIIGDCSPRLREELESLRRVQVTGRVASIAEATADCFAGVAPMQVATGIQNKALEYFALGLPAILSTSVASGLLESSKHAFLVAETPEEWRRCIVNILNEPSAAVARARAALAYIQHSHDWNLVGREYRSRLRLLIKEYAHA